MGQDICIVKFQGNLHFLPIFQWECSAQFGVGTFKGKVRMTLTFSPLLTAWKERGDIKAAILGREGEWQPLEMSFSVVKISCTKWFPHFSPSTSAVTKMGDGFFFVILVTYLYQLLHKGNFRTGEAALTLDVETTISKLWTLLSRVLTH